MNSSIRLDKRDLILAKGAEVMTRRGYHGAGVQEIVQAAGVPKGSFYHYFASKEDFALQALQQVYQPRLARYAEALSNPALSPRERILGYYTELVEHFARQERLEYHCFIGRVVADAGRAGRCDFASLGEHPAGLPGTGAGGGRTAGR